MINLCEKMGCEFWGKEVSHCARYNVSTHCVGSLVPGTVTNNGNAVYFPGEKESEQCSEFFKVAIAVVVLQSFGTKISRWFDD